MMFGAESSDDNNKALKGGGGFGKFGLNQNARITKLEINNSNSWKALDINVQAGGKKIMGRFFVPTTVWCNEAKARVPVTTKDHEALFVKDMNQFTGHVTHIVKALGVKQEQIVAALKNPPTNVLDWMGIMLSLVPANSSEIPVDVFLQWQYKIGKDSTITFLELPGNMKTGKWITPARPGTFVELITTESLTYVNDSDKTHDIERDSKFFESPCYEQQKEGGEDNSTSPFTASTSNDSSLEGNATDEEWV